jgi:hypothetical protein
MKTRRFVPQGQTPERLIRADIDEETEMIRTLELRIVEKEQMKARLKLSDQAANLDILRERLQKARRRLGKFVKEMAALQTTEV